MSNTEKNLTQLLHDLEKERSIGIRSKLSSLSPYEIARLLEAMEPRNREILWRMVDQEDEGEVLKELVDDVRQNLIDQTLPFVFRTNRFLHGQLHLQRLATLGKKG